VDTFHYVDPKGFLPPAHPAWLLALEATDKSAARITGDLEGNAGSGILRGYCYPPPQMLTNTKNVMQHAVCWAIKRSRWLGEVATGVNALSTKSAPRTQTWRSHDIGMIRLWMPDALSAPAPSKPFNLAPSTKKGSKNRHEKKAKASVLKARAATQRRVEDSFDFLGALSPTIPQNVTYSGADIIKNGQVVIPEDIIPLMLWELCELNFRAEVTIMDRMKVPGLWKENAGGRQEMIFTMFPDAALVPRMPLLSPSQSLGGMDGPITWRNNRLEPLRDILSSWPGAEQVPLLAFPAGQLPREVRVEELEKTCFTFYCQAFFDFYGRAPVIPRQFPSNISS